MSFALELSRITKSFGPTLAVDGVDFALRPGTVHALLGENGAGKTTLMRIAFGLESANTGVIRAFGSAITISSPRAAARAGIGMVHQHHSLVPTLRASENLMLGQRGMFWPRRASALLRTTADLAGLPWHGDARAAELSIVEQQRLEILKALAHGARVLILDEPTALLPPPDVDELLAWIRRFASNGGSVVLVTHKLREALAVADDVTVLRHGRVAHSAAATGLTEAALVRLMFAEADVAPAVRRRAGASSPAALTVRNLSVRGERGALRIRDASFTVGAGEIVGIAAVDGSGHRELLLALANLVRPDSGSVEGPTRVAMIPADRLRDGIIPDFSLVENVALHGAGSRRGFVNWRSARATTSSLVQDFRIVTASVDARAAELSGGNQQRLVIARETHNEIDLIVADNPTRGLDLSATAFVHEHLRAAAERGAAVVVHSSDLDEVLELASRIIVVHAGVVREILGDRARIGRAMLGAD